MLCLTLLVNNWHADDGFGLLALKTGEFSSNGEMKKNCVPRLEM